MDNVIGHKIVDIRDATPEEADDMGVDIGEVLFLVLDNGVLLYALGDEEGNFMGQLCYKKGEDHFYILGSSPAGTATLNMDNLAEDVQEFGKDALDALDKLIGLS